eukprot:SAG31_NODE_12262_length_954_cov_2.019883_1_plen_27_part_01
METNYSYRARSLELREFVLSVDKSIRA